MGFKKEDKAVKQKEEEERREEEQQESIILEKPRRSPMSFDKVEQTTAHIVGRKDESFVSRPVARPIIKPRNTAPQHGGKQFPVRT